MKKFLRGFKYAFQGLYYTFKTQVNFRFHTIAAVIVLLAGWFFDVSEYEWLWIIMAIFLVLATELFNTALENLTNLISPEINKKAGQAKDAAAAAVLIIAFCAFIIGVVIFLPKLIKLYAS